MTNKDMNIAMKFTADVNRAKKNVSQLTDELQDSASAVESANKQTAQSTRKLYIAQTEAMNRGTRASAEIEKQARAQEAAAKAAEVHKKEVDKLRNGLDQLLGKIDPATKGLGRLDALEKKLRDSKKSGVIDDEGFDDYLGKINNQRAALSTVNTLNDGTKKLSLNTRTARRDIVSMFRQLSSGNFSTAGNSLFNLGNATGRLPSLFSAASISAVAFVAAAYGIYKVISTILAEQERFNRSLISTGNYAGTTAAGLESMSKSVGGVNHNYSETREVIAGLAQDGQLSAESIENIATASAYMSAVTGKSAKDAISSFKGIQDSVTNWALGSNKQYHFMDLATYNRIAALEAQGKTEEAIAIATGKYADTMKTRAEEMKGQLNWLESAWDRFKQGVADLGEAIKDEFAVNLGLADLDKQIAKLEQAKNRGFYTYFGGSMYWNESFEKDLQALYEKKKLEDASANLAREQTLIQEKAITSQKELNDLWKQNRTEAEKQADAVENIRKQYEALWVTVEGRQSLELKGVTSIDGKNFHGGQYDTDVKAITDAGLKQYNQELSKSLELEKERTTLSKVQFEITEGKYKNATQQEKDIAISLAKQVDALKEKQKLEKQAANDDKTNLDLQKQLNQLLIGSKISDETVDQWYNNLLVQFKKTGNQKGIDLIDELLPLKKADAQLNDITTKIQQAKNQQAIKEQSIQAQVTGGLITQVEAQSQLVDLHKTTAKELSDYLPLLEKMATMPGQVGELGQKAVAQLQLEVAELNKTTDALTNALRNGLQNGIQSSLEGLAKGTLDLSDALTNLAQSIANAMASIASQGLAELAMNGLDNLGNTLFNSTTNTVADEASSAIAATEMSTAITAASTIGATEMGTSLTTSMTVGTTTLTTALGSAFATGAATLATAITSASAAGGASSAAGSAVGAAFAAGGHIVGPGTGTSDSIPLWGSNGEFMIREASVRKYGVDFFHALNSGRMPKFASGGLISRVNTPKAPALSDNTETNTSNQNQQAAPTIQQTLVIDGGDVISKGIGTLQGKRSMMTFIRANSSTLRQVLGVD